jgi:hypothetical protein
LHYHSIGIFIREQRINFARGISDKRLKYWRVSAATTRFLFRLQGTHMNKALLASAVASAFAAPLLVQAQSSSVQIYGTINTDYEAVQAGRASPAAALARGRLGATPTGVNVPSRDV